MGGVATLRLSHALQRQGLRVHWWLGQKFGLGFVAQCFAVAFASAVLLLVASAIDKSLFLAGRDVGLLEHPTIWVFVALQIVLPITLRQSLVRLGRSRADVRLITADRNAPVEVREALVRSLAFRKRRSRALAGLFYTLGLATFVWNTYQNQDPGVLTTFNFWDSTTFPVGFWATRVYKFYLFVLFLPYLGLIHFNMLMALLRRIRVARRCGTLTIVPFHEDRAGGFGFLPRLVTSPILTSVIVSSAGVAAATKVHGGLAVSPIVGLAVLILAALVSYLVPIVFLWRDINSVRQKTLTMIRIKQQACVARLNESTEARIGAIREWSDSLDYFDKIATRVESISALPHFKKFAGTLALALSPSVISFALEVYPTLAPVIGPLIKRP